MSVAAHRSSFVTGVSSVMRSGRVLTFVFVVTAAYLVATFWGGWTVSYPDTLVVPLKDWIGALMRWLVKDFDLGFATFREITRGIAWAIGVPLDFVNAFLWQGYKIDRESSILPLSWVSVAGLAAWLGYRLGGWRLAVLSVVCFGYMVLFGLWESSMRTLSSILVSVPFGCFVGLLIGVAAHQNKSARAATTVILDFMQTVPVFAYLLPVLFLFGFSPVSAMLATMIYATPAMVRATFLAYDTTDKEVVEYAVMAGATRRQMNLKVILPSSLSVLVVGVNQVIVLSLNAVIIASLIGAGGLGFDVLKALRNLRIGEGLEAGIAIVLIAIWLDRVSRSWSELSRSSRNRRKSNEGSYRVWLIGIGLLLVIPSILAYGFPSLTSIPKSYIISFAPLVDSAVDYITVRYFDTLEAFTAFLYIYILNPFRDLLLAIPWIVFVSALATLGWLMSGWPLSLAILSMLGFVVVTGFWEDAVITIYLIGISVAFSALIGIPLGILGAVNDRASRILWVVCDTLQTLPSFVYLVPVVMLFRVGDVPALIAVIMYAIAPAIRYTDMGLRRVDPSLIEGAKAMGCTGWQLLVKVKLPMAFPEVLVGINQTIMLAISMLVITALVGTRDLGQAVYTGLSRADTGYGLVAGTCVAFLAIVSDRLINAYAARRQRMLGI